MVVSNVNKSEMRIFWRVALPPSFTPTREWTEIIHRIVRRRLGDDVQIKSIDVHKREVIVWRPARDDDEIDESRVFITVRTPGKDEQLRNVGQDVAKQYGREFVMTDYDTYSGLARFEIMPSDLRRCRDAVASVFGQEQRAWQVHVERREGGGFRVELPTGYLDSRYRDRLDEIAETVIGSPGWSWVAYPQHQYGEFVPGEPPTFPKLVPLNKESALSSDKWSHIFLGLELGDKLHPEPRPFYTDFNLIPHTLIAGTTGGGKSVMLRNLLLGALVKGWDIVVLDPIKGGLDFAVFAPWVREAGFGVSISSSSQIMESIYGEVSERKSVLREHGVANWIELHEKLGIRMTPTLIVIDEVTNTLSNEDVPKGLSKNDPRVLEIMERNDARANISLSIQKMLNESRYVGFFLVLATQTANQNTGVTTTMRNSIGARMLLGTRPTISQLSSTFSDYKAMPQIPTWIQEDGAVARGVGMYELSGVGTGIFKGAFLDVDDVPKLLSECGVDPKQGNPFLEEDRSEVARKVVEQLRACGRW